MIEPGSLRLALGSAIAFVAAMLAERLMVQNGNHFYYSLALPMTAVAVPIERPPPPKGRTRGARWEELAPGVLRWWADPDRRELPSGLHGIVVLAQSRRGIELTFRWAPPFSPLLAASWLIFLGALRQELELTVPIALALTLGVLFLHHQSAVRAAAELRWAFVRGSDEDPSAEDAPG